MKLPLKWEFPGVKLEFNEEEIACIKEKFAKKLILILLWQGSCQIAFSIMELSK